MVAAPSFRVVRKDLVAGLAEGRLPGTPEAVTVTHNEIRGGFEIGTLINIPGGVDVADGHLAIVLEAGQLFNQFSAERFALGTRIHDASRFPPLLVEGDAGQSEGVGAGPSPI